MFDEFMRKYENIRTRSKLHEKSIVLLCKPMQKKNYIINYIYL